MILSQPTRIYVRVYKGVSHMHVTAKELQIVSTLTICDKQASIGLYGFIFWVKNFIYAVHPLILDTFHYSTFSLTIQNSHLPSDSSDHTARVRVRDAAGGVLFLCVFSMWI